MMSSARATGLLLFAALLGAGCRPAVPNEFSERFEDAKIEVDAAATQTEVTIKRLERLAENEPYKRLAVQVNLLPAASTARKAIEVAKKLAHDDLRKAANQKDKTQAELQFAKALSDIEDNIEVAEDSLERPDRIFQRMPQIESNRQALMPVLAESQQGLNLVSSNARNAVPSAKQKHPAKSKDLDQRLDNVETRVAQVTESAKMVPLSSDPVDFAIRYDDAIEGAQEGIRQGNDLLIRITQLDKEYSKTLLDMKAEFTATFTRWSWNNFADYSTEEVYTFPPRTLSPEQYNLLVSAGSAPLNQETLSNLGVTPTENMTSGHDTYEVFVEDVTAKYFHKVLTSEQGKATETEWEEVSSAAFLRNLENLGMDILFKPYGKYEDEGQTLPAPPGYYLVGNEKYGQWQGSGTNRTWVWLPMFLPFFRPSFLGGSYRYADWDGWNRSYRGKRAYYGPKKDRENSYGTYASGGYASGTYWGSIGGNSRQSATARGVGASFRGGGPGGGGK